MGRFVVRVTIVAQYSGRGTRSSTDLLRSAHAGDTLSCRRGPARMATYAIIGGQNAAM